jgi:hypothetical protein
MGCRPTATPVAYLPVPVRSRRIDIVAGNGDDVIVLVDVDRALAAERTSDGQIVSSTAESGHTGS